jgi:hypothetical protein
MAIENLISNLHEDLSSDLTDGLIEAAKYLNYSSYSNMNSNTVYTSFSSGLQRHGDWGKLCQNRFHLISAISLRPILTDNFDRYTMLPDATWDESNFQIADCLILANDMYLPEYNNADDTVLAEVMANAMAYMCYTEAPYIPLAYASMSTYQSLLTMLMETAQDIVSVKDAELKITPYEL